MENRIILASASPRRSELLERAHIPFEVRVSDAQEDNSQGLEPSELVRHNAYIKALAVARRYPEERVVLGADTIVALDGKIYGKPSDKKRAAEMLAEQLAAEAEAKAKAEAAKAQEQPESAKQ